ncbi:MAG: DUF1488 domain-containing protein [Gammaproteobacteria bacterium]|nr:DUF1488 domain-containing protein [Gammaproteobacteria bacterium]
MNQQLIFNHDFRLADDNNAVCCSVLQAGLRISVFIAMPEGWDPQVWLTQVKEDGFFWEEQIEEALTADKFDSNGILYLDGAA